MMQGEFKTLRAMARRIVDDFCYDIHHSVTNPQIDLSKTTAKTVVACIDAIEKLLKEGAL